MTLSSHVVNKAVRMLVKDAYETVVRRRFRAQVKVWVPEGGRLFDNALSFFQLAKEKSMEVDALMEEAFDVYSTEWCQKTFRIKWPPIALVLSDNVRNKLGSQVKTVRVHVAILDEVVDRYMEVLKTMDANDALECVRGGWPPGAKDVRMELIRRLKCQIPQATP